MNIPSPVKRLLNGSAFALGVPSEKFETCLEQLAEAEDVTDPKAFFYAALLEEGIADDIARAVVSNGFDPIPGFQASSAWGCEPSNHDADGLTNRATSLRGAAADMLYEASDLYARAGQHDQARAAAEHARAVAVWP